LTLPRPLALPGAAALALLLLGWAALTANGWVFLVAILIIVGFGCVVMMVAQAGPALTLSFGLALMMFSGNWGPLGSPFPLDRLAVGAALAGALLRPDMRKAIFARAKQPLSLLLAAVGIFAMFSALRAETLTNLTSDYALLDSLGLVPFALFVVAPVIYGTKRDRDILMVTLVAIGGYLGLTAFFEGLHLNALVFPRYILNPNVGIHFGRARGPFVEADANGLVMFACAVASGIALYQWRRERKALLAAAVLFLCLGGTVFTLTRAIWIASLAATLLTLLAFRQLRRFFLPATIGVALLGVGALALIPGLAGEAEERSNSLRPVWDRLNTDAAALRMFEHRPLTGFGWYTFESEGPEYLRQSSSYPLTGAGLNVHNVFLSRLAELGAIGTLLWGLALGIAVLGSAIRAGPPELLPWRIGLVAIAIDWLIVANFVPLTYALPTALLWLWAGILSPMPAVEAD
jgi:putative inorganic carbon (HCO3(-)) transporter